jgi:high affinity Mn2+ porin
MRELFCALLVVLASLPPASADEAFPYSLHVQGTMVPQGHGPFNSPYNGPESLPSGAEFDKSYTATVFAGYRPFQDTEIYVNPEFTAGSGVGGATGLAAYPNGEINRVGNPNPKINLARFYVSQSIALGSERQAVADGFNQVATDRASKNFRIIAGIFALPDFFDGNAYSHDPRTQFLNWCFMDNCTWDFASDSYGYSRGIVLEWQNPGFSVRASVVEETLAANGLALDTDIGAARGINLEVEKPYFLAQNPGILRALLFLNRSLMRTFQDASFSLLNPGVQAPSGQYHSKIGGALNLEQRLGEDFGLFARVGLSDASTEDWSFTDADRTFTIGTVFKRHLGFAVGMNQLTAAHASFLAAGGTTIVLGDGRLDYAPEEYSELYYALDIPGLKGLTLTPDIQAFQNPGYNRDRGPVLVYAARVHCEL